MPDLINADYQVVQERTPEVIRAEIKTIEAQVYQTTLEGVVHIGRKLVELKEIVGHGNWLPWCKENLGYSDRQARRYIEISENYGSGNSAYSNWTTSSNLSISKAYSLLQLPEDEVESFAEEHDIQDMTVAQLEAEIKEWKSKAEAADASLTEEKSRNAELMDVIDEGEKRRLELVNEITELEAQTADPEEIEKLKSQLEKEKEKVKKAKADLATEKENVQTKIDAAVNAKSDELKKAAEIEQQRNIRQLEVNLKYASEEAQHLRKQLEQSESEEIATFKVMSKQIQQDFNEMNTAIQAMAQKDFDQSERMKGALKRIMSELTGRLE